MNMNQESGQVETTRNRNWPQILVSLSICYICISGGNLVGYTSSAIPSIRDDGNNRSFFELERYNHPLMSAEETDNETRSFQNKSLFGFLIQEQDIEIDNSDNDENQQDIFRQNFSEFSRLTDEQASWIGGLAPLGAFFGSLIAPILLKKFGPKGTVLKVSGPSFLLSWLITAFAPSIAYIYIGRTIGGLGMGLGFSAVPLYIVETASLRLRGPLGTLSQFLFTIGVLMSFIFGYFFDWRTSALVCGFMTLPVFVILAFIPESPIWLLSANRLEDAEWSYRRIHGFPQETSEFQKLKEQITFDVNRNQKKDDNSDHFNFSKFKSQKAFRSTFVAIFFCIFQQLTGINAVNFYTVTIFESATGDNSFLDGHSSAIIVAVVFCLSNLCSYVLIEKLGRKFLLILSTTLISISAYCLGAYFHLLENGIESRDLALIPLGSLVTFVLAFSIGYGPLLYVIVAEILPSDIRNVVSPIAVGINWLCVFIVAKTFPGIIQSVGASVAFWLYGSCSMISLIFTIFYLPETKGKSEEEIQRWFVKSHCGRKTFQSSNRLNFV